LFDLLRGRALPEEAGDGKKTHKPEEFTLPTEKLLGEDEVPGLTQLSQESADLVERVLPSVVSIAIRQTIRTDAGKEVIERFGAGAIVTPEGHVVTAAHVIYDFSQQRDGTAKEDRVEIRVRLANDREMMAEFVGANGRIDIAVLKIISPDKDETFRPLPFIEDSDSVRQGEFVFSFGNPHGLRRSSDFGIISSRERSSGDGYADLFQLSSRLMPGHSGGPLVNTHGQIVGINKNNFGPEPWSKVGFAIVANEARHVLVTLLKKGTPLYGHLGVHVKIAAIYNHLGTFDNDIDVPLEVDSVNPGSAAEKAGIRPRDFIIQFDGKKVRNFNHFKDLVRRRLANEEVAITVRRDGEELTLKAVMAELDLEELFARWDGWTDERVADYIRGALGVDVSNLSAAQKVANGLPAAGGGVLVEAVHPLSPAIGVLRPGDIIDHCNGQRFVSAKQFVALLEQSPRQRVGLFVMRPMEDGTRILDTFHVVPNPVARQEEEAEDAAESIPGPPNPAAAPS
jgi:serine protease Do